MSVSKVLVKFYRVIRVSKIVYFRTLFGPYMVSAGVDALEPLPCGLTLNLNPSKANSPLKLT